MTQSISPKFSLIILIGFVVLQFSTLLHPNFLMATEANFYDYVSLKYGQNKIIIQREKVKDFEDNQRLKNNVPELLKRGYASIYSTGMWCSKFHFKKIPHIWILFTVTNSKDFSLPKEDFLPIHVKVYTLKQFPINRFMGMDLAIKKTTNKIIIDAESLSVEIQTKENGSHHISLLDESSTGVRDLLLRYPPVEGHCGNLPIN
jgi:hypothetical protein